MRARMKSIYLQLGNLKDYFTSEKENGETISFSITQFFSYAGIEVAHACILYFYPRKQQ